jgi:signal transduction histidine kinase
MLSVVQAFHRYEEQLAGPAKGSTENQRRYRLILAFAKLGVLLGSAYSLFYFLSGFIYGGLVVGATVCWMGLTWPLIAREYNPAAVGNYFSFLTLSSLAAVAPVQGGVDSPALPWLAAPPLISLVLSGRRPALKWGLAALAVLAVIFLLDRFGLRLEPQYPARQRDLQKLVGYGGLIAFTLAMAWLIERNREQSARDAQTSLDQLAAANANLSQLHQERADLLGIVAHDLNNPLSVILAQATQLRHEPVTSPTELRRSCDILLRAGRQMQSGVETLLDLKLADQESPQRREPVDLGELCWEVVAASRAEASRKHVHLRAEVPAAPTLIAGDPQAFRRITENLLSNGLKYSPLRKSVWLRLRLEGAEAVLEVEDQGAGVPLAERGQLFNKFARLSPRPTGGESSHGLGLFIVKHLAEACGGTAHFAPAEVQGSRFYVRLPLLGREGGRPA